MNLNITNDGMSDMPKSNTPISDSMNRWKMPRGGIPNGNEMMLHSQLAAEHYNITQQLIPNFISLQQQQQQTTQPPVLLNPITNKIKNKKRIKKNVTVLKESSNETIFVNYTVEEKKPAKDKPTTNIPESNGTTSKTVDTGSSSSSFSSSPTNVSKLNSSNKSLKRESAPTTLNFCGARQNNIFPIDEIQANSNDNIRPQQIVIKDSSTTSGTNHDENDANMDFSKIVNMDRRSRVITPTTTRFYMSSSSTPSSPAIGTPSSAFYANSIHNISAQRPSSAVMPNFTKHASYNGVSPYAKRVVSNKNSIYKLPKGTGSVSTTTLSSNLESTAFDLSMYNNSVPSNGHSYIDNFNSAADSSPNDGSLDNSFNQQHHGSISDQLIDPERTAVSLPTEYHDPYSESLDMGLIMSIGIEELNPQKHSTASNNISRTVTGSTVTIQSYMNDLEHLNSQQCLANELQVDNNMENNPFHANIDRDIKHDDGEISPKFGAIDFDNIEAIFPINNNSSPIKQELDDILNILK
ncbi:hypothetical protein, no similarity [Maudiozyma barnettii]|uniref:Uncharacterized protein n=1 Tax=Maudiozyma barnettii TaxID=61262 RepID=A0A8H2ZJ80_9SACH|nr:hypothetical protein, no similarity [Kazachstania barnettii]CAB4255723.1 hypothetical protein, no similarity [Kazachstania barnettii]CAD1784284.1 hypothetical protein, no similarity [Kazachstania barnettii]